MTSFLAIAKLTCRSAVRSKVFRFLLCLLLLCSVVIPLTIKGDGTITGEVQILLEYSTGIVGFILSTSIIWMTCSEFCTDIENFQIHLIFVKPVSRLVVWAGKFAGVFFLHLVLLFIASSVIYGFAEYKKYQITEREKTRVRVALQQLDRLKKGLVARKDIKETEEAIAKNLREAEQNLIKINNEVFTGRRSFLPVIGDINAQVKAELAKRIQESAATGQTLPELTGNDRRKFLETVKMELLARKGEAKPGGECSWQYEGLPENFTGIAFIRYKFYSGDIYSKDQKQSYGAWKIDYTQKVMDDNDRERVKEYRTIPMVKQPEQLLSGIYHEFAVPGVAEGGQALFHNGKTSLSFYNLTEPGQGPSVHFQVKESPRIMIKEASFTNNYFRMVLVTALGLFALCMVAAFASSFLTMPTAIFISLAYIFLGLFSKYIVSSIDETTTEEHASILDAIGNTTGEILGSLLIPIQDFFLSSLLSGGELIEFSYMAQLFFFNVLLKGLPLCILGLYLYRNREAALLMRK
ncbi:MAG: hypothetical protein J6S53_09680 [Lentisphaeria bacterium]|nr:hypothetical protein [Lentisphaeria bacterium]